MSKLTNLYGMPDVYCRLIQRQQDQYSASSPSGRLALSVTTLQGSPWRYKLAKVHEADLEEDSRDRFFAFRGQMMHAALEQTSLQNVIPEVSLGMEIDGVWVSGRVDVIVPGAIEDYKMKTVEAMWFHKEEDTRELAEQLNPYRYMLWNLFQIPIERLTAHVFLMNWVGRRAKWEKDYPKKPHFEIDVPIWTLVKTEAYLLRRIALFRTPIEETPMCSPAERWAQPATFAIMQEGKKRAMKVARSMEEAEAWIVAKWPSVGYGLRMPGISIKERPGTDSRCTDYCNLTRFCEFWQNNYNKSVDNEP